MIWQRMKSDKLGLLSLGFVLAVLAAGALAPLLAPHDPLEPDLVNKFAAMGLDYPLGTDHLGRCTFSRLLFGIRTTVLLSLATMAATLAVGTLLGVVAGYRGGWVDETVMRVCDVLLSFPSEVMILAMVGMLGPGLANVILASIVARWAWYTRMIRGAVVQQRSRNHILFARVAGCGSGHILLRHLLPDIAGEVSVLATLDTGWVILSISGLSFLCLGVQAPTPEWGMMLSEAKNIMTTHPSQMLAPGLAILAVVAAFNFLGDSIQAALNPRTDDIQARR
jgi:nickel transport system permease protein